jgi:hypothetical protein
VTESLCDWPGCTERRHTREWCEHHYRYRLHTGRYGFRDATRVTAHLKKLRQLGWTWEQIGDAADLSSAVPYNLLHGRRYRRVRVETEHALLAVAAEPVESHRGVDGIGTRRRLQALAWMGWAGVDISRRVALRPATLHTLACRGSVSVRTARRVTQVYDELSHIPGPPKQSATKARKAGYAPPAAWDDAAIDDPGARPHGVRRAAS